MSEPKRVRRKGRVTGLSYKDHGFPYTEAFADDPDFDELIDAAQEVVETGLQSSDGRHCIVLEVIVERLRKALEPRNESGVKTVVKSGVKNE